MNAPKFELGQTIKHVNSPKADAGPITGFSYNESQGYVYTISVQDWDATTRQVLPAVMHVQEDEAELVTNEQPVAPSEPATPAEGESA